MSSGPDPISRGVWSPPFWRVLRGLVLALGLGVTLWQIVGRFAAAFPPPPPALGLALLAAAVLLSDLLRLPLQNGVMVGLLSGVAGGCLAWALIAPSPVRIAAILTGASVSIIALPGARAAARELLRYHPQASAWNLLGVTTALAVPAWKFGEPFWRLGMTRTPSQLGMEWAWALAGVVGLQLLLTPWWIDKRGITARPDPAAAAPWPLFMLMALSVPHEVLGTVLDHDRQ